MKKHKLIENLFFILCINGIQFFTAYYQFRINGDYTTADIIFNVIFSLVYTLFFITVFARNSSLLSAGTLKNPPDKLRALVKFLILMLLRAALEAAMFFLASMSPVLKYIGGDLLILAYLCCVYIVSSYKNDAISKNKKHLSSAAILLVIAMSISLCYSISLINQYNHIIFKYAETSPYLVLFCKNLDFLHSIKEFVLETALLFIITVFHAVSINDESTEDTPKIKIVFRTYFRCDIILFLILLILLLKLAVVPDGLLEESGFSTGEIKNEDNLEFNIKDENNYILRGSYSNKKENSYHYSQVVTLYKNDTVEQFNLVGKEPNTVFTNIGIQHDDYIEFSIDGHNVFLYGHYAIGYFENEQPRIIRMDSINQCVNKPIITGLLKHLLEDGNLFVFEYAGEYLNKYEADFIKPYVERYKEGSFTITEKQWMKETHYRSEYIVYCAKNIK